MSGGSQPPYKRTCCRCGNFRFAIALFPDGHICQSCLTAALRTWGPCRACGRDRPLIGRLGDGTAACRECAGITREFTCRHCGYEGEFRIARTCLRCRLARKLAVLLDDGTGQPRAELKPLAGYIRSELNPRLVESWLRKPGTRELLAGLATGRVAISHEALAARGDWRRTAYMRDLLVASGVLPAADRQLTAYEGWLHLRLARLDGHPHHRLLREFGLWHQLPRMRARAAVRPLRATACKYAQNRFLTAEVFLDWITARGLRAAGVAQADIDAFYTSHKTYQQQAIRSFLTWAITQRHMPPADVPVLRFGKGPGITQEERLALIRRFATGDGLPLHVRVAACLMLLYAQPLPRVLRLAASDIIRDDALRAAAAGLHPDEAGTDLIISHGIYLGRDDFTRHIHAEPSISDGTPMAWIDWDAVITALDSGQLPSSGTEKRILRIAAGHSVNLCDAIPGLDQRNVSLVATAVRHAAGQRPCN